MILKTLQFLALVLTGLTLVPAGAHLFALPNKIGLEQESYFITQQVYAGWTLFGFVIIGALVVNGLLAVVLKGKGAPFGFALAAALLIAAMLAVFFTWTYPTNVATENWTYAPENWRDLKAQWEWSHAAGALLAFAAFCCVALSVLTTLKAG